MPFDAKKYLETLEKPTYIALDGTVYEGELVSFNEVLPILEELSDENLDTDRLNTLTYRATEVLKMDKAVADELVTLPPVVIAEALQSFFLCLRGQKKK